MIPPLLSDDSRSVDDKLPYEETFGRALLRERRYESVYASRRLSSSPAFLASLQLPSSRRKPRD